MTRSQREKAINLGLALLARSSFDKTAFLEANTALTQTETAGLLGCRAEDVQKFIKPDYRLNGRPKYKISSVRAYQAKLEKRTKEIQG